VLLRTLIQFCRIGVLPKKGLSSIVGHLTKLSAKGIVESCQEASGIRLSLVSHSIGCLQSCSLFNLCLHAFRPNKYTRGATKMMITCGQISNEAPVRCPTSFAYGLPHELSNISARPRAFFRSCIIQEGCPEDAAKILREKL
jgi:hypothetical protein